MILKFILTILKWCLEFFCFVVYYTFKALLRLSKYVYQKLKQSRPKTPSMIRYDKDTNELEVLK